MPQHETLPLVVILLATAVVTVAVFRRLKMPAILGYLLVGVVAFWLCQWKVFSSIQ